MKRESLGKKFSKLFPKILLIMSALAVLTVVSGCSQYGSQANQKYYTGYNSVEMSFLTDSPPTTFYYDSQAAEGSAVNTIPISVQVQNLGAADTYGALFIQGFDPNIVAVQGYTQGYPGYTGAVMGTSIFSGWLSGQSYGINLLGLDVGGGRTLNLGMQNIGGNQMLSFSSFSGITDRASLFSAMGFTVTRRSDGLVGVSAQVLQQHVGSVLKTIVMGMFNTYGWGIGTWLKTVDLEGRNPDNPMGSLDVVEFPATIINLPPSLEQFTQRIMITSCFPYATHASTMVCIDPQPYSNVQKVCTPGTVSLGGGQGAPVAVTSIEQRASRGKTAFTIHIHHNKKDLYDQLYDVFSLYKCNPASGQTVKVNDMNIVHVGYVYLSDQDITMNCVPDQVIRLDDSGDGQITCSVAFPPGMASSAYQAPLAIELWYGYSKSIYRDVIIKKI